MLLCQQVNLSFNIYLTLLGTRADSTYPQSIGDGIGTSELIDTNQHGPTEPTEVNSRNTLYELPLIMKNKFEQHSYLHKKTNILLI